MAWNHSSQRAFAATENRAADCSQVLTAIGCQEDQCVCSLASSELWMDAFTWERIVLMINRVRSQFAYCFHCLTVCLLFKTSSVDPIDGSSLLSCLI